MTAPAAASSAQPAPTQNHQGTRAPSGSTAGARSGQGNPLDLFAHLLGLISATRDGDAALGGTSLLGDAPAAAADAEDASELALADPDATLLGQANPAINPLADLVGWPGAAAFSAATAASESSANANANLGATGTTGNPPQGAPKEGGISLQGMTVLAQPGTADPRLVPDVKTSAAQTTPAGAAPDSDAVSVRYSDTPASPASPDDSATANAAPSRSHPVNWRSTTALAQTATAGATNKVPGGATSQTAAIQLTQNASVQRGPVAAPALTALPHPTPTGDRADDITLGDAATGDPIAPAAAGQASKEHTGSSGGERETSLGMGATAAERQEAESTDEPFSLDAALAAEEELDGTEFLTPHALRHANVRVGEGTDEAIDIRLSLEGDAVSVDFRTDNADVRAGLQHNAGESLSELMQRGGIQLGGVSVGAESQHTPGQSRQGHAAPERSGMSTGRIAPGASAGEPSGLEFRARAPTARRSDGGPALDIFA
jgi:flagellar hook-length control protein FliK